MPEDDQRKAGTRPLRLMLGGDLAPTDAARATAFVSLGSQRLRHDWALATDGEPGRVDAVLSGLDDPPTIPCALDQPVVHLRMGSRSAEAPDGTLRSPLQFDELIEALAGAEAALGGVTPAREAASPPAAAGAPAAPLQSWDGVRFRLHRWPPAALLQGSRYGVRLASFMSARFVTLVELEQLSNVGHAECAGVVRSFMDQSLLHVRRDGERAVAPRPAPAERRERPAAAAPRSGLLSALRRRLGLAAGR